MFLCRHWVKMSISTLYSSSSVSSLMSTCFNAASIAPSFWHAYKTVSHNCFMQLFHTLSQRCIPLVQFHRWCQLVSMPLRLHRPSDMPIQQTVSCNSFTQLFHTFSLQQPHFNSCNKRFHTTVSCNCFTHYHFTSHSVCNKLFHATVSCIASVLYSILLTRL